MVLALMAPSVLKVEHSTTVNTPVSTVYGQVVCFDKWPAWSPWDSMDPTNTNEYSENPCGLNAWNSWTGEQTGSGTQTIVEETPNEYIKTSLVFGEDPRPQVSEWHFSEENGVTTVSWNFIGTEASFFARPMNLMGKYFLTQAYETGLAKLKEVAESAPAPEPEIEIVEESIVSDSLEVSDEGTEEE